jgi:hypothetical protein
MQKIKVCKFDPDEIVFQLDEAIEYINAAINCMEPGMLDEDFQLLDKGLKRVNDCKSTIKRYFIQRDI